MAETPEKLAFKKPVKNRSLAQKAQPSRSPSPFTGTSWERLVEKAAAALKGIFQQKVHPLDQFGHDAGPEILCPKNLYSQVVVRLMVKKNLMGSPSIKKSPQKKQAMDFHVYLQHQITIFEWMEMVKQPCSM